MKGECVKGRQSGLAAPILPSCPQCGSENLRIAPYEDCDAECGYHDYGVLVTCNDCGAVSTAEEMEHANS